MNNQLTFKTTVETLPLRMLIAGLILGLATGLIMGSLSNGQKFTS